MTTMNSISTVQSLSPCNPPMKYLCRKEVNPEIFFTLASARQTCDRIELHLQSALVGSLLPFLAQGLWCRRG
jgi:hypothetical protein